MLHRTRKPRSWPIEILNLIEDERPALAAVLCIPPEQVSPGSMCDRKAQGTLLGVRPRTIEAWDYVGRHQDIAPCYFAGRKALRRLGDVLALRESFCIGGKS